jgi:hypothetical protein
MDSGVAPISRPTASICSFVITANADGIPIIDIDMHTNVKNNKI